MHIAAVFAQITAFCVYAQRDFSFEFYFHHFTVVFVSLGCSGIIPIVHILIAHGITIALKQASMGWLILMGVLYITGAILYATRVPERFFPGKCNIVVSV